jgi:hypothetical protein
MSGAFCAWTTYKPCGRLRCGTAATRAAPDPDHPPLNGTHSAPHSLGANVGASPRAQLAAVASADGSAAAPRSRPLRACMALREIEELRRPSLGG